MKTYTIPDDSLVILVGPAGCGKSTFAKRTFAPSQVVSTDALREMLTDDAMSQHANNHVFDLFHSIIDKRLKAGRLTVADATNLRESARSALIALADASARPVVVVVFETSIEDCLHNNRNRSRVVPDTVITRHYQQLAMAIAELTVEKAKGRYHTVIPDGTNATLVSQAPTVSCAPGVDVIGDVHGCLDEAVELLLALGYSPDYSHPENRQIRFAGDFVDRGPNSAGVLLLVAEAVNAGKGHAAVLGNHDDKLRRLLAGNNVGLKPDLIETRNQLMELRDSDQAAVRDFLGSAPYQHTDYFAGRDVPPLTVAHAGIPFHFRDWSHKSAKAHSLYGETLGMGSDGLPIRGTSWCSSWDGKGVCVYGHTPVRGPHKIGSTYNIDTGCVFGHELTALRYPEMEFVAVPARAVYSTPRKPF